jgi:hypothetical protein
VAIEDDLALVGAEGRLRVSPRHSINQEYFITGVSIIALMISVIWGVVFGLGLEIPDETGEERPRPT